MNSSTQSPCTIQTSLTWGFKRGYLSSVADYSLCPKTNKCNTVPLGDWLEKKKSASYNHKTTIWVSHEYYLNPEFHKIPARAF